MKYLDNVRLVGSSGEPGGGRKLKFGADLVTDEVVRLPVLDLDIALTAVLKIQVVLYVSLPLEQSKVTDLEVLSKLLDKLSDLKAKELRGDF